MPWAEARDVVDVDHHVERAGPHASAADALGLAYESLLDDDRRTSGAYYTPRRIAEGLVDFALAGSIGDDGAPEQLTICDPSVGGGAFLLAAARWLERAGFDRAAIVRDLVYGSDLDPLAVDVTECALWLWSAETGAPERPGSHLAVGDALLDDALDRLAPDGGYGAVVGNPPFLSQLSSSTVRSRDAADALRARFGSAVGAYTDTAALFLLAALDLVAPGGRVCLIVPESFLSARDAAGVRRAIEAAGVVDGLWVADEPVFGASVDVCAPVLQRAAGSSTSAHARAVRRALGPDVRPVDKVTAPARSSTWSPLVIRRDATPAVDLCGDARLDSRCRATAGFRDQYYGLAGLVYEDDDEHRADERAAFDPRLVTSGSIDPGRCSWGERPVRFARQAWRRPRVDLARLLVENPRLARWTEEQLVPKVVVATQTRVVEAAVDVDGRWYPSTPTIAVVGPPADLWRVAAVLLAPPISAWALRHRGGGALARDALKLAARDVLALPLPVDEAAWAEAADDLEGAVERASAAGVAPDLDGFGHRMCAAYQVGLDVHDWWLQRLPA
jgi:hypothetical protein